MTELIYINKRGVLIPKEFIIEYEFDIRNLESNFILLTKELYLSHLVVPQGLMVIDYHLWDRTKNRLVFELLPNEVDSHVGLINSSISSGTFLTLNRVEAIPSPDKTLYSRSALLKCLTLDDYKMFLSQIQMNQQDY